MDIPKLVSKAIGFFSVGGMVLGVVLSLYSLYFWGVQRVQFPAEFATWRDANPLPNLIIFLLNLVFPLLVLVCWALWKQRPDEYEIRRTFSMNLYA